MKAVKELRNLSAEELRARRQESEKELFKLRGSASGAPAGKMKENRKSIARILTIIGEKERLRQ